MDRDGFLRRGWTRACLNDDGKIPSERERLTRFVMIIIIIIINTVFIKRQYVVYVGKSLD